MKLVMLYGPPAAGKLTVGAELAQLTGFKLFHNHVASNVAQELFAWGTPAQKELKRMVWEAAFDTAIRYELPGMIFTYVYLKPKNEQYILDLIGSLESRGVTIHLVQLTCDLDELRVRIPNSSRHAMKKLVDIEKFERYRTTDDTMSPLPVGESFVVDTTHTPPLETARLIQAHYQLPAV